ncbi:hypothetical protein [Deinococcus hopiensis]|nr:hypothetical protein [Deinococcus hopiensis]
MSKPAQGLSHYIDEQLIAHLEIVNIQVRIAEDNPPGKRWAVHH